MALYSNRNGHFVECEHTNTPGKIKEHRQKKRNNEYKLINLKIWNLNLNLKFKDIINLSEAGYILQLIFFGPSALSSSIALFNSL